MTRLTIQDRTIGPGEPLLVIAEIGVNHDGQLARALELVQIAARCGADACKLQVFRAHTLMHASAGFAGYQKERCGEPTPADMLRRYELSPDELRQVTDAIRSIGMIPLATPFSMSDIAALSELGLPALKIASPDLVNRPLLKAAASLGRPMLLSTGAATMQEIAATASWLRAWQAGFALLHCVSSYPTPIDEANLCWIGELAGRFGVPVGFSDHTPEPLAGALAVAAGASLVEKHLTYDRAAQGPDHAASADPEQFAAYVRSIRLAERLVGRGPKRVLAVEEDVRRVSRQSLVLVRDVPASQAIVEQDLTTQRPASGIPASEIDRVVGRRPVRALPAGTMLQWDMLSNGQPA